MNLDQFIKYYTDYKNLKDLDSNFNFICPICKNAISNSNFCPNKIFTHKIEIYFYDRNVYLFLLKNNFYFNKYNFFIYKDKKSEYLGKFNYEDFGEVTLEKLKKLENNLLFLQKENMPDKIKFLIIFTIGVLIFTVIVCFIGRKEFYKKIKQ